MIDQRVFDYVKNTYNKGFSEEHIRLYLSNKGISNNELDEVFALIRPKLIFFKKIILIFRDPNKLFDYVKLEPQKNSCQYFLIIFIIFSLLILIPLYIDRYMNELKGFKVLEFNISNYLTIIVGTFLILFFFAVILDFFTHYFYGKGIHENFRIMIYAITPIFLFIWIPYFGAIVSFYSIFLLIVGIKKLHDFTINKSIIALLLVILTIVVILSLIYIFSYYL